MHAGAPGLVAMAVLPFCCSELSIARQSCLAQLDRVSDKMQQITNYINRCGSCGQASSAPDQCPESPLEVPCVCRTEVEIGRSSFAPLPSEPDGILRGHPAGFWFHSSGSDLPSLAAPLASAPRAGVQPTLSIDADYATLIDGSTPPRFNTDLATEMAVAEPERNAPSPPAPESWPGAEHRPVVPTHALAGRLESSSPGLVAFGVGQPQAHLAPPDEPCRHEPGMPVGVPTSLPSAITDDGVRRETKPHAQSYERRDKGPELERNSAKASSDHAGECCTCLRHVHG